MPDRPGDVEDDGDFHFVVLGPKGTSEAGKPNSEAKRFLSETTGPDTPRVFQNTLILAVPARDGLDQARNCIRDYLAWEEVQNQVDTTRAAMLAGHIERSRKKIPGAI